MKIILLSDIHLRETNPKRRNDSFPDAILNKLQYIFDYAHENQISAIFQAGDVFDHWRASKRLISQFGKLLVSYKSKGIEFYCIPGQHDQRYHSTDLYHPTPVPLGMLDYVDALTILNENPIEFDIFDVYGSSWKSEIPKIKNKNKLNILVIHKMIIKNDKLWTAQEDFTYAKTLLKENDFDIILSGDNHNSFEEKYYNKELLNCGSLLRSSISQKNHLPYFIVYNTIERTHEKVFVPVQKFEDVFSYEKFEEEKERVDRIEKYREKFEEFESNEISFEDNARLWMDESGENDNVLKYIGMSVNNDKLEIKEFLERI